MANAKKNTTRKSNVEIVERDTNQDEKQVKDATVVDGIYTEEDVELGNGIQVPISVIVDKDMLPASVSSLVHEGNLEGMLMAQMTADTRRILDLTGATRKDLREIIAPVVQRAAELEV